MGKHLDLDKVIRAAIPDDSGIVASHEYDIKNQCLRLTLCKKFGREKFCVNHRFYERLLHDSRAAAYVTHTVQVLCRQLLETITPRVTPFAPEVWTKEVCEALVLQTDDDIIRLAKEEAEFPEWTPLTTDTAAPAPEPEDIYPPWT